MTKDELISRISLELYDLKHKLEVIRAYTEEIYLDVGNDGSISRLRSIDIINLLDSEEIYDN